MTSFDHVGVALSRLQPSSSPALPPEQGEHLVLDCGSARVGLQYTRLNRLTSGLIARAESANAWGYRTILELDSSVALSKAHLIYSDTELTPSHFTEPENFWPVEERPFAGAKPRYLGPNLPQQLEICDRRFDLTPSRSDVTQGDGLHFILTPNSSDPSEPNAVVQGEMVRAGVSFIKQHAMNVDSVVVVANSPNFRKKAGAPCHIHIVLNGPNNILPNFETPWSNAA